MDRPISYGINRIKTGYIFLFFSINFPVGKGVIDLFPNCIGYVYILSGIVALEKHRKSARVLELPGIVMTVVTFISEFSNLFWSDFWGYYHNYAWAVVIACMYVHLHFGVITEISFLCKEHDIYSHKIETGRNFVMVYYTIIVIAQRYLPLTGDFNSLTAVAVFGGFIVSITAIFFYISILTSFSGIENSFKEKEKKPIPLE